MSAENRPNLNAVGLVCDIIESVLRRRRGAAAMVPDSEILQLITENDRLTNFIEGIDDLLDRTYGVDRR